jgi:hypothetical protein
VRLIIDVEPLDTALSGRDGGSADEARANTPLLYGGVNGGVQQKGVNASVPGHVHEPDQDALLKGANVAEATAQDRRPVALTVL